jgi:phosphate transport system permease protein
MTGETMALTSAASATRTQRVFGLDVGAAGEPAQWALGGALALGIVLIVGFLIMVMWNGIATFYPRPIQVLTLTDGSVVAGPIRRSEEFRVPPADFAGLSGDRQARIRQNDGMATRHLVQIGNFDLYNEDFRWVPDYLVTNISEARDVILMERLEWGPFIGRIKEVNVDGRRLSAGSPLPAGLAAAHTVARDRWATLRRIERGDIGVVNHEIEEIRLDVRRTEISYGPDHRRTIEARAAADAELAKLRVRYDALAAEAQRLRQEDTRSTVVLADVKGQEKRIRLSEITRFVPANDLSLFGGLAIYFDRWWEFLIAEPREANTEGGVMPAIFGTFVMTLMMVIFVAPFGVMTALYLREYAKQGRIVAIVRISVNNLAGVPSIVYGVFGVGFFAYFVGGSIDAWFYPERLPSPTFGTGGILWSALTLALLTVPVVIVATEEALSAVPRSVREGSLACGASKWQTIKYIVLPQAMPGIMTGLILAMARGAGEVAPLMLVGVVKLAPELPIDGFFPFVHLERSFMHLGFHIYDVGFQSRNSEAGKPMVFVTTMLLIALIFLMNLTAIIVRNRLKRRFVGSQF